MEIKKVTAADLVRRVAAIARQDQQSPRALFTILAGAGVSLGAGMPSTATLVAAMKARKDALGVGGTIPSWPDLLSGAESTKAASALAGTTAEYQALFNDDEIFPSPLHRQGFISEAIVWASGRRAALSSESTRIASILLAGAGRRAESGTPAQKGPQLGRWLAHTLYTTNFDEVIPQALRYCGEPVIIVDHPGAHGRLQGEPNYPRVAYLHGCHLHYSLRNTAAELGRADADRTGGVDIAGLFLRFRDVLRSTGLIVLGYSGWNDRAVRAISDALADDESLPYGVYWGARFGEKSLSDTALQLLRKHPDRAFMMDENKDAAATLETLCVGLGIPYQLDMDRWRSRFTGVHTHFDFLAQSLQPAAPASPARAAEGDGPTQQAAALQREFEQSKLVKEAVAIDASFDGGKVREWLGRFDDFAARERSGESDLSPELLWSAGRFRWLSLDPERALLDLQAAYQKFQTDGAELSAALVQSEIVRALTSVERYAEAEAAATEAGARLKKIGDLESYVSAISWAANAARAQGRLDQAERWINEASADAERSSPEVRANFQDEVSKTLGRRGKLAEAEAAGLQVFKLASGPFSRANTSDWLGQLTMRRGDLEAARRWFVDAKTIGDQADEPITQARAQVGLGQIALVDHRFQDAVDHLERAKLLGRGKPLPWGMGFKLDALLAEAGQKLGLPGPHAKRAMTALEELNQKANSNFFTIVEAKLAWTRVLAEAGQPEMALEVALRVRDEMAKCGEIMLREDADKVVADIRARKPRAVSKGKGGDLPEKADDA